MQPSLLGAFHPTRGLLQHAKWQCPSELKQLSPHMACKKIKAQYHFIILIFPSVPNKMVSGQRRHEAICYELPLKNPLLHICMLDS